MANLFKGVNLTNAAGETVSADSLNGKIVGLYFSAHWCPPCRGFTPVLVDFYNEVKKGPDGGKFEIVFLSSDQDESSMKGYMTEAKMPWLALPFGNALKEQLSGKYSVRGIPTLIILSPDGETVSTNARMEVAQHGVKALDSWKK